MQALELTSSEPGFAQITLSIGVIAWLKRAYDAYKAARLAGLTSLAAVGRGIRTVTLNATRVFIATAIVAIIAEILLFLMEKAAVVYTELVNMTDDDLIMDDLGIVNGKQLVQFVDPLDAIQRNALISALVSYSKPVRLSMDIGLGSSLPARKTWLSTAVWGHSTSGRVPTSGGKFRLPALLAAQITDLCPPQLRARAGTSRKKPRRKVRCTAPPGVSPPSPRGCTAAKAVRDTCR